MKECRFGWHNWELPLQIREVYGINKEYFGLVQVKTCLICQYQTWEKKSDYRLPSQESAGLRWPKLYDDTAIRQMDGGK